MDPLMMSDGINDMSALIHNLSMMMSNEINDILETYVHIHQWGLQHQLFEHQSHYAYI